MNTVPSTTNQNLASCPVRQDPRRKANADKGMC